MPSTYSTSLKLELIANGEQSGTWGATTNNNLGTLIEQAITGVGSLTLVGDTTLTNYNGLPDESRNAVLTFSGALSAPANVIAPSVQKTYVITNNSGANVTVKTATGNGVTVSNGLSALIYCDGTNFYTAVNVNNVIGDLTVSGNEVISGSVYLGNSTISGAAGNLTLTANASIIDMSPNTGAFIPPTGTIAQRPASPTIGMSRWNSESGVYEIWNGLTWQIIASGTYTIDYLVVAGGGGGGAAQNTYAGNGGGGAGGLLTTLGSSKVSLTPGTVYSIAVGSGGASGAKGANSSVTGSGFTSVIAIGGGYGGATGGSGGSGGAASGSGTVGQGNAGGAGGTSSDDGNTQSYSGGGGAGGVGNNASGGGASAAYPGAGGIGLTNTITGSSVYYAGGGGGGSRGTPGASGGNGGGGAGGGSETSGTAGTSNRGGGGGGSGAGSGGQLGGAGGSGVVILSIPTTNYSGTTSGSPTVTTTGSYTILTYTSSGSYTA